MKITKKELTETIKDVLKEYSSTTTKKKTKPLKEQAVSKQDMIGEIVNDIESLMDESLEFEKEYKKLSLKIEKLSNDVLNINRYLQKEK